ncbi:hypothetical protein [Chryseobacterium sp. c4a]|nr:hypothetical protein [Chryseobacterium sp. c4a]
MDKKNSIIAFICLFHSCTSQIKNDGQNLEIIVPKTVTLDKIKIGVEG